MGLEFGEPDDRKPGQPKIDRSIELDDYLRQCVKINPEDIQGEFVRIPSDLAYWNAQYAATMRRHLFSKIDTKVLRARLEPIIRAALIEAGAKLTEGMVKAAVDSDDRVIEAEHMEAEADVAKNECYGYLDSIRSKKDMLISLGAQLRAEMEGDPLIREQVRSRKVMGVDE